MPIGYTPIYRILKDGLDITGHFNDRCTQIRIDYSTSDNDTAMFTLDDRDWTIARPSVGDRIQIYLGYDEVGLAYQGSYEVAELVFSGLPKSISMKCSSMGQRSLLKSQSTQNLENKTIGEVAKIVARAAGVEASVSPDVADIEIAMRNMTSSPLQLMSELNRQFGLVGKFVDGQFVVTGRDSGKSVNENIMPIVVFTQEHFGAWQVKHNQRPAYSTVKAAYVDPDDYITKFVEHALPKIDGIGNIPYVPGRKFNNKAEAEAAAKAQAQSIQRSLGEADLQLAKGDPWLRDQQRILIRGMRDGVNGSYVTDLVSHTYVKDTGILTAIKAKPDSEGTDYEKLFDEANADFKRQNFLLPGAGGLIGSVLTLRGGQPNVSDLYGGVDPFD